MASQVPHADARRIVDTLVQKLEGKFCDFNISEIIEGGSLGHGTTVFGNYDIDLVIYSRDITGRAIRDTGGNLTQWLTKIDNFLQVTFPYDYAKAKMTSWAIKFNFKHTIDVDLLISPYWTDQHEFYRFLRTIPRQNQGKYTVCASKWQVQFFREQPAKVKELIRKAKEWRNEKWSGGGQDRPTSFLLSILVVAAYEKNPHNVTAAIQELVTGHIDLCWERFYQKRDYKDLLPARPRVVDPGNPANNLWISGFKDSKPGEKHGDYDPGNGKSAVLVSKIHTLRLD